MHYINFMIGFVFGALFVGFLYLIKKLLETNWLPDETTYDR